MTTDEHITAAVTHMESAPNRSKIEGMMMQATFAQAHALIAIAQSLDRLADLKAIEVGTLKVK